MKDLNRLKKAEKYLKPCPICKSGEGKIDTAGGFIMIRCQDCGCGFAMRDWDVDRLVRGWNGEEEIDERMDKVKQEDDGVGVV